MVVMLVERFSSTLQLLDCDVLDDWALNELANHCQGLTHLFLACSFKDTNALVRLCANNPSIESVDFRGSAKTVVTNRVMEQIISVCHNMKVVHLGYNHTITADIVPILLDNCPNLAVLAIPEMEVAIRSGEHGLYCDLTVVEDASHPIKYIEPLLNNLHIPIGRFGTHKQPIPVDGPAILTLASKFGATLTHLWLRFEAVSTSDVHLLLRSCPLLVDLSMHYLIICAVVDDEALAILSKLCPKLETLNVINCAYGLTDEGLTLALRNWAQHQTLKELRLDVCCILTDAVLPVILDCLPNLTDLQVHDSNFTKEGLLALSVQMIPKRLKGLAASTVKDSLWIQEALPADMRITIHT